MISLSSMCQHLDRCHDHVKESNENNTLIKYIKSKLPGRYPLTNFLKIIKMLLRVSPINMNTLRELSYHLSSSFIHSHVYVNNYIQLFLCIFLRHLFITRDACVLIPVHNKDHHPHHVISYHFT